MAHPGFEEEEEEKQWELPLLAEEQFILDDDDTKDYTSEIKKPLKPRLFKEVQQLSPRQKKLFVKKRIIRKGIVRAEQNSNNGRAQERGNNPFTFPQQPKIKIMNKKPGELGGRRIKRLRVSNKGSISLKKSERNIQGIINATKRRKAQAQDLNKLKPLK